MAPNSTSSSSVQLVRAVGAWDLTWQVVNIMIGATIFVLPGLTVQELGGWAPAAVFVTAAGVLLILLPFAEAAGRYREAGGLYRYAGDAFGEFVGVQIGLLYWLVRVAAGAAVANVFAAYTGEFWAAAAEPAPRAAIITALLWGAGWINVRGTRRTATVVNIVAIAKLLPLAIFCVAGLLAISATKLTTTPLPGAASWGRTILLWVLALSGFESNLIPAGEVRRPEADGPRALFRGVTIVVLTYALVQLVVAGTWSGEITSRPVGEAARIVLGDGGALLIAGGALISAGGYLVGSILVSSRITFAIADRGGLPPLLARVHPRFRTPDASIVLFTLAAWILAITGSFAWNASISAVARLNV